LTVAEPIREEPATETVARISWADRELAGKTIAALRQVRIPPAHADARALRRLARVDLDRITAEECELVRLLSWRWRRQLPAGLAPKLNPADPIVRSMEAHHG